MSTTAKCEGCGHSDKDHEKAGCTVNLCRCPRFVAKGELLEEIPVVIDPTPAQGLSL